MDQKKKKKAQLTILKNKNLHMVSHHQWAPPQQI